MKNKLLLASVLLMKTVIAFSITAPAQVISARNTTIAGSFETSVTVDSISVTLYEHFTLLNNIVNYGQEFDDPQMRVSNWRVFKYPIIRGKFYFQLPHFDHPVYVSISADTGYSGVYRNKILSAYLLEPLDSVQISIFPDSLIFTGAGSQKFSWRYQRDRQYYDYRKHRKGVLSRLAGEFGLTIGTDIERQTKTADTLICLQLLSLSHVKNYLSRTAYNILYADIIGFNKMLVYHLLYLKMNQSLYVYQSEEGERDSSQAVAIYEKNYEHDRINMENINDYGYSAYLTTAILAKYNLDKFYYQIIKKGDAGNSLDYVLNALKPGLLRDKVFLSFLVSYIQWAKRPSQSPSIIEDNRKFMDGAALNIWSDYYKGLLNELSSTFTVDEPVMNFEMEDSHGNIVHLSDFKGKIVLMDFWFTGCGACKYFAQGMRKLETYFDEREDIVFLSISIDNDKNKWLASIMSNPGQIRQYPMAGYYYAGSRTRYLYTGGQGFNHPFITKYIVGGYPTVLVVDRLGNLITYGLQHGNLSNDRYVNSVANTLKSFISKR